MILLPGAVRVYVATQPVNLRKSYDGLSNEVRAILAQDPLRGHVKKERRRIGRLIDSARAASW